MSRQRDHVEGPQYHIRHAAAERPGRMQRIMMRLEHSWTQVQTEQRGGVIGRHGRRMLINFFWRGTGVFRCGKQQWPFAAPCCVMRRAHQQFQLDLQPGHFRESWVICSGAVAELLVAGGQVDESRPVIAFEDKKSVQHLLLELEHAMAEEPAQRSWAQVLARLQTLCAHIWGVNEFDSRDDSSDMQLICQAVHRDPSRNWRLADLAELCGCLPATLRQRFHRRFQCGPSDAVTMERMEMAGELLQQMLVKQVAHHLGYADYRSFSRQFKKYYGCTPQAYRNMSQQ